jgi:hypothetical protein
MKTYFDFNLNFKFLKTNIMKKSILVLAFAGFFGFATLAQQTGADRHQQGTQIQTQQHDKDKKDKDFRAVSVDNVPDAVERAVRQNNRNANIQSAEQKTLDNGQTIYKVRLSGVQDGEETQMFYSDGREFEEGDTDSGRLDGRQQRQQDGVGTQGTQGRQQQDGIGTQGTQDRNQQDNRDNRDNQNRTP